MEYLLTRQVVELVFCPLGEVADWFNHIGLEATKRPAGVVVIKNPYLDFTTGIYETLDPITRAVCLAGALTGHAWPQVFPNLLQEVDTEWKRRRKQEAAASPKKGTSAPEEGKKKAGLKRKLDAGQGASQPTFEELFRRKPAG